MSKMQHLTLGHRLPLRIAIDLLIARVDQLSEFICQNGLQPPSSPKEKDAALNEILNALGPTKSIPGLDQMPPCEPHTSPILPKNHNLDFEKSQSSMGPPLVPTALALPKFPTAPSPDQALLPAASQTSPLPAPSAQGKSSPSADTPESILSSWDMDLAYGGPAMSAPADLQQLIDSTSERDALGLDLDGMSQPVNTAATAATPTTSDDGSTIFDDSNTTANIEGLIDELSDRVGTLRIGRGGKTHFFGPTSTFNLRDIPHSYTFDSHRRMQGYDNNNPGRIEADKEVPAALEAHLINLYFSWQDPSFHVVDRKLYEDAKEKWFAMEETSLYSEALRNAMWVF